MSGCLIPVDRGCSADDLLAEAAALCKILCEELASAEWGRGDSRGAE
jgi:hypothetical protein